MTEPIRTVVALLTSHERAEATVACLDRWFAQRDVDVELEAILVDAGSRDGTADRVASAHPRVDVVRASADLFWNGGMREALERFEPGDDRAALLLNDDTMLDDDSLVRLLRTLNTVGTTPAGRPIIVGATRDPADGHLTYGGLHRPDPRRPLAFDRVPEASEPVESETMNGNCVLLPPEVVATIGSLDPAFTHHLGDVDYGLRARRAGFEVWVAPGTVGTCATNPTSERSVREEARHLRSPKGLPFREWGRFARRWAGPAWPVYFASPYVRRLLTSARRGPT